MPPVPIRIFFVSEPGARQQNLRARVGKAAQSVMLGEPIALVAKGFSGLGQFKRGGNRIGSSVAADDGGLVKDGEFHAGFLRSEAGKHHGNETGKETRNETTPIGALLATGAS